MRLIDADALEAELNERVLPILIERYGRDEALRGLHFSFRDCICNIQSQPTIEPEPYDAEANYWHEKANSYEQTLVKLAQSIPKIIRCKDCKHYVLHVFFGRVQGWCERLCDEFDKSLARGTEDDDFCSRAERRGKQDG